MWGFYRFLIVCPESRRVHDDMIIWDARNCAASEGWCATSTMRRKEWHSLHWQKWFSQSQTVRSSSSHAVLPNLWESNLVSLDSEVDSNLAASYLVIFLSFLVMAIWQYHAIFCLSSGFHGLDGLDGRLTKVASPPVLSRSAESRQDSTRLPTNQCCHHVTGC